MAESFYPHPFDELAVELCHSARRYIRILSPTLDREVFDKPALSDALSSLARRSRHADVRILVQDVQPLVGRGHRLLSLARRIPSVVHIQVLSEHPELTDDTLVIRDNDGLLYKPAGSDHQGFYQPDSRAMVREHIERFDEFWQRSATSVELRQLRL